MEVRPISDLNPVADSVRCTFRDGTTAEIPPFLGRFLTSHDALAFLSAANTEVLIRRQPPRTRAQQFLFATIGYAKRFQQNRPSAGEWIHHQGPHARRATKRLMG